MKKILVTGADGFIGSHLVESLVKQGYTVRAFIFYNSIGSRGWLDKISPEIKGQVEFFMGDIRDPFLVRSAMIDCVAVIHLAALIGIPYSYVSPSSYVDTNVTGTLNLLHSARELGVAKFIHTSTSEVYGSAQYVPIDEHHPLVGQSPYSATKIAADQLAYSFYASFGVPVSIIRPFNTYGPRQSNRAVIPTIITQVMAKKTSISLGSLSTTRDFSYIQDTVDGFIAALKAEKLEGETINLGSGFEISIGELVKLISNVMGKEVVVEGDLTRIRPNDSEVDRLMSCNKKAKSLLNWSPKYCDIKGLSRGIKETVEWFSVEENLKIYSPEQYVI